MVEFSSGLKGMALNLDARRLNLVDSIPATAMVMAIRRIILPVMVHRRGIHLRCPEFRGSWAI